MSVSVEPEAVIDEPELDESSAEGIDDLVKKLLLFIQRFCDVEYFPYQIPIAYSIVESIVLGDGDHKTLIAARQSGKSEVMGSLIAGLMVILPRLADVYPYWLGKFKKGFMCGVFAPTEEQADTIYGRVVKFLTSDHATDILLDEEVNDRAATGGTRGKGKVLSLKNCGSLCRMQTCNPKAKIEGRTYHLAFVDESQGAEEQVILKSIIPMLGWNNGTLVLAGTATREKCYFYKHQQANKRSDANRRGRKRTSHHEYDWRLAAKYNSNYAKFIDQQKIIMGEDSDEFRMSFCVSPETKILTADLRHVTAGSLTIGDKLVGFDEERPGKGLHRQFRESVILDLERIHRPSYELCLDDGTVVTCSAEHKWLTFTAGSRTEWKATQDLVDTDRIFKVTDVWDTLQSYEAGYLSAAFDGEGHLAHSPQGRMNGLIFAQKENGMISQVRDFLQELGYCYNEYLYDVDKGCLKLQLAGGRSSTIRFLGEMRPQRLLPKFNVESMGSIGRHDHVAHDFRHPRVLRNTFVGDREVVAMKTSTGTYVAEGLASHNCNEWILEKGMFITDERLEQVYESSLQRVHNYWDSPIVAGIDVARSNDSTVVTVVFVDWDHPDGLGFYRHVVLDWLEINDVEWEDQYFQIIDFLRHYDVLRVGIDAQGVGGAVAERLAILLPRYFPSIEVLSVSSDQKTQHERWVHLTQLIQRGMLTVPGHSKARRTRDWKKFNQQMSDLERVQRGPYMLAAAPEERGAFDDYPDSLAIACSLTIEEMATTVTVLDNMFYDRRR